MAIKSAPFDLSSAIGRWAGLGPYYAMFPLDFAFEVVEKYSRPGQAVLDPFVGRGSSIFAAASMDRTGLGIEINPVGWLYGWVKLAPAPEELVLKRLYEIAGVHHINIPPMSHKSMEFFSNCYSKPVLDYLCKARDTLRWKVNKVDATLMAIILVYLHGKSEASLSNQMRQGKAMSPNYCVRWWKDRGLKPPDVDPVDFLSARIRWRYSKGIPSTYPSKILLGDSQKEINKLYQRIKFRKMPKFNLLFTSPPYCGVTNYHYDQWLRLWMLGGADYPKRMRDFSRGKFARHDSYRQLLKQVFFDCTRIMDNNAKVYVRTDARSYTFQTTLNALSSAFPDKGIKVIPRPYQRKTQTSLFGDFGYKPGEIDIVMQ